MTKGADTRLVESDGRSKLEFLDRKMGVLPVLIYLYDHGPTPKTAISRFVKYRYETIRKTLHLLGYYGLVAERREGWFPYRQTFALTQLGRMLVETPIRGWSPLLDQPYPPLADLEIREA